MSSVVSDNAANIRINVLTCKRIKKNNVTLHTDRFSTGFPKGSAGLGNVYMSIF